MKAPFVCFLHHVLCSLTTVTPKILCHASPFAKISDELRSKVVNSGIALLTTWCPQQLILSHSVSLSVPLQSCSLDDRSQATGWFLTHGAQWFDVQFVRGADF